MQFTDNSHMIPILESVSRHMDGLGFVLLMEHPSKNKHDSTGFYFDYSIHPRSGQPCQGGDMRKYEETHPGECTQPHNKRPGDLYAPFPAGKPSAATFHTVRHKKSAEQDEGLKVLFSDSSPWKRGFGSSTNVKFMTSGEHIDGFTLLNLDVDPTVLISLLWFTTSANWKYFTELRKHMSDNEALACMLLNNFQLVTIQLTDGYHFPARFSPRRFFEGRPNDLSGGLFSQGVDYNRSFAQDVFSAGKGKGIVWHTAFGKHRARLGLTFETYKPNDPENIKVFSMIAKEVFAEGLANESELTPEDTRYVYRGGSGKPLPYPEAALKRNPTLNLPITQKVA